MKEIKFAYRDEMSNWEWKEQTCVCESIKECREFYGLGIDCEYRIIDVKEI